MRRALANGPNVERVNRWEEMVSRSASFNEDKHPRDEKGRFAEKGIPSVGGSGTMKPRRRKEIRLGRAEYARVMHKLNTNLTPRQRRRKQISKPIGDYVYDVEVCGFGEYRIIGKKRI